MNRSNLFSNASQLLKLGKKGKKKETLAERRAVDLSSPIRSKEPNKKIMVIPSAINVETTDEKRFSGSDLDISPTVRKISVDELIKLTEDRKINKLHSMKDKKQLSKQEIIKLEKQHENELKNSMNEITDIIMKCRPQEVGSPSQINFNRSPDPSIAQKQIFNFDKDSINKAKLEHKSVCFNDQIERSMMDIFKYKAAVHIMDEYISSQKDKVMSKPQPKSSIINFTTMFNNQKQVHLERVVWAQMGRLLNEAHCEDNRLHLAILYASPLGYVDDNDPKNPKKFKFLQQLAFQTDIHQIKSSLKGSTNQINFTKKLANINNFQEALRANPIVLHFIGHGMRYERKGKHEDYLLLENQDGSGNMLLSHELKKMVEQEKERQKQLDKVIISHQNLEVVFLSSCYSEGQADVFMKAKAKHIICIKKENKINDEACIVFSRAFYKALFNMGKSPCESFQIAQQTLRISKGLQNQASLFQLITPGSSKEIHKCTSFVLFNGLVTQLNKEKDKFCMLQNVPAMVALVIGRHEEQRDLIQSLQKNRIVTLIGFPSIGKVTVVNSVINFFKDRNGHHFKNGILFMSLYNQPTYESILQSFIKAYYTAIGDTQNAIQESNWTQPRKIFDYVLSLIGAHRVLIVFTKVEDHLAINKNNIKLLVDTIIEKCPNVTVLMSSHISVEQCVGEFNGATEKIIELGVLNLEFSEKLLVAASNRPLKRDEKSKLQKMKAVNTKGAQFKSAYHHLFEGILGGHPLSIRLAASVYATVGIQELYNKVSSTSNLIDALTFGQMNKKSFYKMFQKAQEVLYQIVEQPDYIELVMRFPSGLRDKDLAALWQIRYQDDPTGWKGLVDNVSKYPCIFSKKEVINKVEYDVFTSLSVATNAKKNLLEDAKGKDEYIDQINQFFINMLQQVFDESGVKAKKTDVEVVNTFQFHQSNLWEVMFSVLEVKKSLKKLETAMSPIKKGTLKEIREEESIGNLESDFSITYDENLQTMERKSTIQDYQSTKGFDGPLDIVDEQDDKDEQRGYLISKVVDAIKTELQDQASYNTKDDKQMYKYLKKNVTQKKETEKVVVKKSKLGGSNAAEKIKRQIQKSLRNKIVEKVNERLKDNPDWDELQDQEDIYQDLTHKIMESQAKHRLFKGLATYSKKGQITQQSINDYAKILILFVSDLILLEKIAEAHRTLEEYGPYFYDKGLCEANIRKLKGLCMLKDTEDVTYEIAMDTMREFINAQFIYEQLQSNEGQAICSTATGYVLKTYILQTTTDENRHEVLTYAKKKFIEAILHYEMEDHLYGQHYCYESLIEIKKELNEAFIFEYKKQIKVASMLDTMKQDDSYTFIERQAGPEMSLFLPNIMSVKIKESKQLPTVEKGEEKVGSVDQMMDIVFDQQQRAENFLNNENLQNMEFFDKIQVLVKNVNSKIKLGMVQDNGEAIKSPNKQVKFKLRSNRQSSLKKKITQAARDSQLSQQFKVKIKKTMKRVKTPEGDETGKSQQLNQREGDESLQTDEDLEEDIRQYQDQFNIQFAQAMFDASHQPKNRPHKHATKPKSLRKIHNASQNQSIQKRPHKISSMINSPKNVSAYARHNSISNLSKSMQRTQFKPSDSQQGAFSQQISQTNLLPVIKPKRRKHVGKNAPKLENTNVYQ